MTTRLQIWLTVSLGVLVFCVTLLAQATHINTSGTLPTHCTPGDIYHKSGSSVGLYDCSATDTWTGPLVDASGAGAGTVTNTGTLTSGKVIQGNGGSDVTVSSLTATFVAAASGVLSALTGTQATALLDAFVGDSGSGGAKGLVPAPAAGDAAAGKFLKADGTFAVPSGSGGGGAMVLLEEHTASSSSSLDFTTRNVSGQSGATFQSDFDQYEFSFANPTPASGTPNLVIQFSTDGGSTFLTSGYLDSLIYQCTCGGTGQQGGDTAYVRLNENYASTSTAGGGVTGRLFLTSPLSTSVSKMLTFKSINVNGSDSNTYSSEGHGRNTTTSAVNAARFKFTETGGTDLTMASGTIRLYGLAK